MSSKVNTLLIGLVLVSLTSASLAFGRPCGGPGQGRNFGPGSGGGYRMAQELNLSVDQQQQFQNIIQEQRKEAQEWREQHRKEAVKKLSTVLNEQQLTKFKAIKQYQSNRRGRGLNQSRYYRRGMGVNRPCNYRRGMGYN